MSEIKVIKDEKLSKYNDNRFVVINKETGDIIDDAQGYGYKTAQKAYAAYYYKNRDRSKDKEKLARKKHIKKWMKENKGFIRLMDAIAFEMAKGAWGPDDEFNAKFVGQLLKERGYDVDFTPGELLRVWRKG